MLCRISCVTDLGPNMQRDFGFVIMGISFFSLNQAILNYKSYLCIGLKLNKRINYSTLSEIVKKLTNL